MPFSKFRVFDPAENEFIHDEFYLDQDSVLFVMEHELRGMAGTHLLVQFQAPFTDAAGDDIFQGDTLTIPYKGQVDAVRVKDSFDVTVDWNPEKGRWSVYEDVAGWRVELGPLCEYARKGTIKR